MAARVEIYTKPFCGFCLMAKRLLKKKKAAFEEIDIARAPGRRGEMIARARGGTTVPQIFIDGTHVGGCDELHGLERAGRLDAMLADRG